MKSLVFIKIGGSLITDKTKQSTLREEAIEIICGEIKKALQTGKQLVIGRGNGSFGHFPAHKYQTHKGVINEDSYRGIAEVAYLTSWLNTVIIKKLLEKGVNAVSISPISIFTAKNHKLKSVYTESVEELLKLNMVPLVYGDQIIDTKVGCTIFSTERILGYLALRLKKRGYKIERIIHCGQTNGVYDAAGQTIPLINSKNFSKYKKDILGSNGTDVTGGMLHKVEEALSLAKKGIPGLIIDGIEHGSLSRAVRGEEVLGTKVEK